MKLRFPGSGAGPIGIDADGRWIKAAQLRRFGRGWSLTATATLRRETGAPTLEAAETRRLASTLERRGFEGRRVVLGLPRGLMLASNLELPPADSGAPLEQIARLELARATRTNAVAMEMAMWNVPTPFRGGEFTHAMALGAPHESTEPMIRAFADAGLEVQGIDARVLASARSCAPQIPSGGMTVTVDVGWESFSLGVFLKGVLVFERAVTEAGLCRLYEGIRERFEIDDDAIDLGLGCPGLAAAGAGESAKAVSGRIRSALTEFLELAQVEVDRSVSYVQGRYPQASLDGMLVIGDGAGIAGLTERLGDRLDAPVRAVGPQELVPIAPHLAAEGPIAAGGALLTAIGLAMHTGATMEAAA